MVVNIKTVQMFIYLKIILNVNQFQLNTEWAQVEVIDLINDGSGLAFGIIGGRSTGVVVKTILPGGVADRVNNYFINQQRCFILFILYFPQLYCT